MGELRIGFLHTLNKRCAVGLSAGYRFKVKTPFDRYKTNDALSLDHILFLESNAYGVLLSGDLKYRLGPKRRTYWETDVFLRYWELPETNRVQNIIGGLKFLLGREWIFCNTENKKIYPGVAGFLGVGTRIRSEHISYTSTGSSTSDLRLLPSIHLGAIFFLERKRQ